MSNHRDNIINRFEVNENRIDNVFIRNINTHNMSPGDIIEARHAASNSSTLLGDMSGVQFGAFADINDNTTIMDSTAAANAAVTLQNMGRTLETIVAERQANIQRFVAEDVGAFTTERERLLATVRAVFTNTAEFLRNTESRNPTEEEVRELCGRGIVQIPIMEDFEVATATLNDELARAAVGDTALERFKSQSQYYFKKYFDLTREIIRVNAQLQVATRTFTRFEKQIAALNEIGGEGAEVDALNKAYFEYIKKQAAELNIEEIYKKYLDLTKQWSTIRDLALLHRIPAGPGAAASPTCGVCIDDPVSVALNPCGHTFCSNCFSQLGRSCPICRRAFNSSLRLFFS